jgi:hypothetical protein
MFTFNVIINNKFIQTLSLFLLALRWSLDLSFLVSSIVFYATGLDVKLGYNLGSFEVTPPLFFTPQ